jgi:hypothetical protein
MGLVNVHAKRISNSQVWFMCPQCMSAYKKNGEPTIRAKPIEHANGNNGDMSNRIESRVPHCRKLPNNITGFNIIIDDATIRF